jgi:hypothetical protein
MKRPAMGRERLVDRSSIASGPSATGGTSDPSVVVGMYGGQGRLPGQFSWTHGLACPSENELYAADENNWRVQQLVKK